MALLKNPFRVTGFFTSICRSLTSICRSLRVGCVQTSHILGYYTALWQKGKIGGLKIYEVFKQNLIFNQNKKYIFFNQNQILLDSCDF